MVKLTDEEKEIWDKVDELEDLLEKKPFDKSAFFESFELVVREIRKYSKDHNSNGRFVDNYCIALYGYEKEAEKLSEN